MAQSTPSIFAFVAALLINPNRPILINRRFLVWVPPYQHSFDSNEPKISLCWHKRETNGHTLNNCTNDSWCGCNLSFLCTRIIISLVNWQTSLAQAAVVVVAAHTNTNDLTILVYTNKPLIHLLAVNNDYVSDFTAVITSTNIIILDPRFLPHFCHL